MKKVKIGYVIRLYGVPNAYAGGKTLSDAPVFLTRETARQDKRKYRHITAATKQEIYQVELNSKNRPKRIIKKVR